MKITQTNNDELLLKSNGVGNVFAGALMAVIGIVMAVFAFLAENTAWTVVVIGGIFVAFSILLILSAKNSHTVLRREGESEVDETKIATRKKTSQVFSLNQVAGVGLETNTSYERSGSENDRSTDRVRTSVLYLQLSDNSQIPLATKKSSKAGFVGIGGVNLGSFSKPPLTDEANKIATFIGVPLNAQSTGQVGAQSFGQMVDTIRQSAAPQSQQTQETAQSRATPQEVTQPLTPVSQSTNSASVESPLSVQQVAVDAPQAPAQATGSPPISIASSAPAPADVPNPSPAATPPTPSLTPATAAPSVPLTPLAAPVTPPTRVVSERTQEIIVPPRR